MPANRADALVAVAESMLDHGPATRDGGDRYQAVVVVDAEVLVDDTDGTCEVEDGPSIDPETARRIACDAHILAILRGRGGEALDVGRSTRSIPRAIRRALRHRDGGCRFPGCTQTRYVDGHHVVHWAHGGPTALDNLVLLCRFHHRAVHEGGFGPAALGGHRGVRVHHAGRRRASLRTRAGGAGGARRGGGEPPLGSGGHREHRRMPVGWRAPRPRSRHRRPAVPGEQRRLTSGGRRPPRNGAPDARVRRSDRLPPGSSPAHCPWQPFSLGLLSPGRCGAGKGRPSPWWRCR